MNEPRRFVHLALESQLFLLDAHSSMSEHLDPSQMKPLSQAQLKPPGIFEQEHFHHMSVIRLHIH